MERTESHILMVDDSADDQGFAREALRRVAPGCVLHAVGDGYEAVEFLRRRGRFASAPRPDLILCDLYLPSMSGAELIAEVKSDPGLKLIPLLVFTASRDKADIAAAYGLNANGVMVKPVGAEALERALGAVTRFWLESATLPPALGTAPTPLPAPAGPRGEVSVLLLEDHESYRELLAFALRVDRAERFHVTQVSSVADAVGALQARRYDVVLADLSLPDGDKLQGLERLRTAAPDVPIVVLTSLDDDEIAIKALKLGVQDYLRKGEVQGPEVARALRYALERHRLEGRVRDAERLAVVGRVATGVAHDFNNMMTVVRTATAALRSAVDDDALRLLDDIEMATERAAALTRQLTSFSRHHVRLTAALDLNEVVQGLERLVAWTVGRGVKVTVEARDANPRALIERSVVEQALVNLVVNARDAMPDGGSLTVGVERVTLSAGDAVALHPEARPGRYVRLWVRDTGEGIAPEVLPRIFEPFFSTRGPTRGTGLGLVIVRNVAAQHRGWVTVDSTVGEGTTFSIYLPRLDEGSPQTPPPPPGAAPPDDVG